MTEATLFLFAVGLPLVILSLVLIIGTALLVAWIFQPEPHRHIRRPHAR
jgi:hypothetical protein